MARVTINNLGIPSLAGVCSHDEACNPGPAVEQNGERLKRLNYVESRLVKIIAAHIPRTPEWEVKSGLALHIWQDAEHAAAIRKRVGEMREPPLRLDDVPDARLEIWLDEVIRATSTVELLIGLYRVVKPEIARCIKQYLAETNPLFDHPTCRALKFILLEEEETIAWGERAIRALTQTPQAAQEAGNWERHLRAYLAHAGGVFDDRPAADAGALPSPRSDGHAYVMDATPRRDGRFINSFDQSHWKYTEGDIASKLTEDERGFALIYRRVREMDVPEFMAPMIYNAADKPWEYYVDMTRQLWDEARHALMGEVGLYANGMAFYEYPIELEGSMALNTAFTPLEAHMVLWNAEQNLMRRDTGKRSEWVVAQSTGQPLVTALQDYDWADEVLHAQIGRRWLLPEFSSYEALSTEASKLGQKWFVEMDKLIPSEPQEEWWPKFVADLRQRRQRLEGSRAIEALDQQA